MCHNDKREEKRISVLNINKIRQRGRNEKSMPVVTHDNSIS